MTTDWAAEFARLERGRRHAPAGPPRATPPPPLSEAEVADAERDLGITFPSAYRRHLRTRSAGGKPNRLVRGAQGWGWDGDSLTNYALLTTPFPHPDSYRALDDELDGREPPHQDAAAWRAWDHECGVLQERKTAGAVFVREGGCGFSTLLVVTGPHRGEMWFDARATCERILPLTLHGRQATFDDWPAHADLLHR
ncbi:SMI1/KNR4 family protein [Streptomyces sp. NPDC087440]|uniref:SMI1/KNR4 family protein n=1 Tax=Streptomyces sp. NPDC087440 TaxID=3365790 RepID=UPI003825BE30